MTPKAGPIAQEDHLYFEIVIRYDQPDWIMEARPAVKNLHGTPISTNPVLNERCAVTKEVDCRNKYVQLSQPARLPD